MNFTLFLGAVLGFISIGLGAYINHVVSLSADIKTLTMLQTALHYQLTHAIVIVSIGLAANTISAPRCKQLLKTSGWLFIVGTCLFAFSIYCAGILGMHSLLKVTPTGGVILMIAWLMLASVALLHRTKIN
jgi:uncharacterized membrane protein YgdD (TMEM256/DUF423 family)